MMNENIKNVLFDYLAIGLDPKKVTIYKQSDIGEHTELAWIFDTFSNYALSYASASLSRTPKLRIKKFQLELLITQYYNLQIF